MTGVERGIATALVVMCAVAAGAAKADPGGAAPCVKQPAAEPEPGVPETPPPPPLVTVEPVEAGDPPPPPPVVSPPPPVTVPPPQPAQPLPPGPPEPVVLVPPTPPPSGVPTPLPPPASNPMAPEAELPPPAMERAVADPAWTQIWFLPTARTLREGDMYAHYIGYMGAFGVQYGINGNADIGAGLGLLTLELAAKYAFVNRDGVAFSLFATMAAPIVKDTWPFNGTGTKYFLLFGVGPLLSLWNERAELDVGITLLPFLQWEGEDSAFDVDYPLMPWIAGSIRLGGSARVLLGVVDTAVLGIESLLCRAHDPISGECTSSEPRGTYNIPTILFGFRFHGRKFAADIGLAFPLEPDWWDYTDWVAIPFATFGHLW